MEVIPGVGVVRLVTNKELCQVIWGIIIKKFRREGSGRINLPALRCREFSCFLSVLRYSHPTTDA